MHQEANNNQNCTINQISVSDKESAQTLATTLQQFMNSTVNIVCNEQNKDKLNKLYQEFIEIVNSFDSVFYLSKENIEKLKSYVVKMEVFEEDFKNESDEGKIFYNNLFALLMRIDISLFINKYEQSPKYVQEIINNKFLYSTSLFEIGRKEDSIKKIDEIISVSDEDKYFIQKCYFLFIDKNIRELKKLLSTRKIKDDKTGLCGVFELEILYSKEKNINKLKKLNRKYKNKPLYHLRMAEIVFEINNKFDYEIKENIKSAFLNINDDDLLLVLKLIDTSILVKQENYVLKLLKDKEYKSVLIKSKLLNILVYKEEKTEEEIERIKKIIEELENIDLININNVNAILSLGCHKELEAIDYFNKSYEENKTLYSASNLLSLILKNNDVRYFDKIPDYIETLNKSQKAIDYMLISSAYMLLNNPILAIENAYIASIVSQNNNDYFMRFWAIHTKSDVVNKKLNNVTDECVLELVNSTEEVIMALDKNITSKFDIKVFCGTRFINDKSFEINVFGKCIGDTVTYNKKQYEIKNIYNKYDYFLKLIFPKINVGPKFKIIENDDGADPLKGIKDYLIKVKNENDEHFKMYDLEENKGIGLPLCSFVDNESKTYRDILLGLLYTNDDYKLYAGEINPINSDSKFVIDITSLVMLEQYDLLVKLIEYKDMFFITQSTINTISKTFNYYLNNKKDTLSVFVDQNNELRKQELTEDNYKELQEFWRNILEVASKFNIVNHESSLDKRNVEPCQMDTIDYSIKEQYTLVSEDLILKKLAYVFNNRVINSTNFLSLAEYLCTDVGQYISIVKTLSSGKYIYCINELTFLKMILHSFEHKDNQESVLEITENILSTHFLFYIYLEIVLKVILFTYYYENIEDKDFYINLIEKIQEKSQLYKNEHAYQMLDKIKKSF